MGRNMVVLNHLGNLQWAQLLGDSWLWEGRKERRRGKICWDTMFCDKKSLGILVSAQKWLWLIINHCHFFLKSLGLSNHIKQKGELAIPGKSCFQLKLYLMLAKAIKPNNKVSELDLTILFEGDLSVLVSSSSYCQSSWFQSNSESLSDAC